MMKVWGRRRVEAGERVHWPNEPLDPFFNVNTPEDLAAADRLALAASTHA